MMCISVKVSLTFDPFSVLSVPIPKKKQAVTVMFMSAFPSQKPIQVQRAGYVFFSLSTSFMCRFSPDCF